MRISDWSSDVCSSDLDLAKLLLGALHQIARINPTGGYEQRVVRRVPSVIEVADVLHRNLVGFLRIAYDRMTVWCRGPQSCPHMFFQQRLGILFDRSEERRVGKEWDRTCSSRR